MIQSSTLERMNKLKKQLGLHTTVGTKGNPFPVKKLPIVTSPCPICGIKNFNTRLRCRKCDTIIVRKRGGGDGTQQKAYVDEFLDPETQRDLAKQNKYFQKSTLKINTRQLQDEHDGGRR